MRILTLSHEALVSGNIITKRFVEGTDNPWFGSLNKPRNIYYRHPELFRRQEVVDELVDDLACTLGLGRDALNVVGPPM